MKKAFSLMLLFATILIALASCSGNQDEPTPVPEDVMVKLDYSFFEQGSMSRSAEDIYQTFYNDYIKTKQLAPYSYYLVFQTDENTTAAVFEGPWSGGGIRLKEGNYNVGGDSTPKIHSSSKGADELCDSLYLVFNEPVSITKTTEKVVLSAKYDCYLLLFNANNIKSITAS